MRSAACVVGMLVVHAYGYVTTPEEHGAKGDGKTNDWLAITAAVNSCSSYSSCHVSFANSVRNNMCAPKDVRVHGV